MKAENTHTEKLNHQDVVMLLQCVAPGALPVSVVLPGGCEWSVRREGVYWFVSSCRRPLCHRYQVKAVTKVALGFVLNEKKGGNFALSSSNVWKKKAVDFMWGFQDAILFCLKRCVVLEKLSLERNDKHSCISQPSLV